MGATSHELRTPIGCIMTILSSAQNDDNFSTELYDKYIQPSINNCYYLLNIVNDILDFTKICIGEPPKMIYELVNLKKTISEIH